ncbi:MAG TPA: PhnD/SsuA/transferrin family substrate-binding protein [Methylibium sp.]|uniref:phosphate/phosphite/phosphonate ABC transporter substrate-binding protein n=1 Tax=Methylibium sp. TaxID=2067992 RepID=UPI002DBC6067|nr:PhnD/SsuA/transferrin family substrate-binding protein [Methylibium sp.]HEU4457743.1 PhnD/SsuA/transferrin family substrate-binding protein [Methylibium sp.]
MYFAALRAALVAILALHASWAQALVFAVNEGVTYRVPPEQIAARYAAIAADLSKLLKQPVTVEPVGAYPTLRQGLAAKSYDIAMVHPAHLSIVAMKQSGYKLIAVTKGFQNYSANFLVKADSPLKTLNDLKDKRLGAPDEDSITSWMVRATLRDALGDAQLVKYSYTRYQDAVPFFVENNLTQAGATASGSVIKDWQAKGGRILAKSKPVPIKHLIAAPSLSAEQVAALRDYFVNLDASDEGKKKLEPIKLQGFAAYDEAALLQLGAWLGL